ncbi:MAG: hypothetical protein PSV35_03445 [bacterium]|nr:hypothetical protein [bacterium]
MLKILTLVIFSTSMFLSSTSTFAYVAAGGCYYNSYGQKVCRGAVAAPRAGVYRGGAVVVPRGRIYR